MPDEEKPKELNFVVRERMGAPIYASNPDTDLMVDNDPFKRKDDIYEERIIWVPLLTGYARAVVHRERGVHATAHGFYWKTGRLMGGLQWSEEEKCWLSTCAVNMNAVKKLTLSSKAE